MRLYYRFIISVLIKRGKKNILLKNCAIFNPKIRYFNNKRFITVGTDKSLLG